MKRMHVAKDAKRSGMHTIKGEIQKMITVLVACSLLIIGIVTCSLNYSSTIGTLKQSMQTTATVAADQINYRLKSMMNIVEIMGSMPSLASPSTPVASKRQILDDYMSNYDWRNAFITDTNGISIFNPQTSIADRDYFKDAIAGKTVISDPVYGKESGELRLVIAAPLWKDGTQNSQVIGVVLAAVSASNLSDVTNNIKVSPNGSAYILNSEGTVIAHEDYSLVENADNTIEDAKNDSALQPLADLEQQMIQQATGFGGYRYGGRYKYLAYAPIGIDNWSLGITAPASDFMSGTILCIVVTIIMLICGQFIGMYLARKFGVRLGTAVKQCSDRLHLLAKGDLETPVPDIQNKDETRILADSTIAIVQSQRDIIGDIGEMLSAMADGDFTAKSRNAESYVGDYQPILTSIESLQSRLRDTLVQIDQSADQVSSGSDQVSSGAQTLSQAATQQAASVQELSATMTAAMQQIQKSATDAESANQRAAEVGQAALSSNERMQDMMGAMEEIRSTSSKIGKIIKDIEDIAFQTNILALNAAVEAARAGAAGKGFAVVADEVRNLASKSAEASQNTASLIESSLDAVRNGVQIAESTADALSSVISGVSEVADSIRGIADSSRQQADSAGQVTNGLEQISNVVQTNSATAEQSAAASEELSGQAQMLKTLVGRFRL